MVANHEMGHAIVAMALPSLEPVHRVSIIPRGLGALGYTLQRPTEEHYLLTCDELFNKLTMLLGGRAAETLKFQEISTGAGDDLAKATDIARAMVMQYGMDETLGNVVYEPPHATFLDLKVDPGQGQFSEETSREIDCAVRTLVDGALARDKTILIANRGLIDEAIVILLNKETLGESALAKIRSSVIGVQAAAPATASKVLDDDQLPSADRPVMSGIYSGEDRRVQ